MSCITKILEAKGDKEFIVSGEIAIEGGGTYRGHEYLITFVNYGHRCGYVAVSPDHPICTIKHEYSYPELEVHGGVTYFGESRFEDLLGGHKCEDRWIGFDAGHCYDIQDIETSEKYFGETEWTKYRKQNPFNVYDDADHRSFAYMEQQCKNMIDQLLGKEAA